MMQKQTKIHKESAHSHMVKLVSTASLHETVGDVLLRLQDPKSQYECVDYTYVLRADGVLDGVVSIKQLLNSKSGVKISKLMTRKLMVVHQHSDQEHVANVALNGNIKCVPVVDKHHHLLGVVPSDIILSILKWEHTEDMLRLSGIHGGGTTYRDISHVSSFKMGLLRIPSILVGLVGGMLATSVVNYYEVSLEKNLILAFFIPLIVYMNDAVGTQTETILVRLLGTEKVSIWKYFLRELGTGFFMGLVVGFLAFSITLVWHNEAILAATIGLSLLIGVTSATVTAIAVPYTLFLLKKDPAISGGPFTTVLQDIFSLMIYFTVASLILH
ncbi:magnesium transporter [Candidatus Peregrinibacteria bacterium]|nr:magnesium transporter [Candidatus Peregrinibacteria bacterium]